MSEAPLPTLDATLRRAIGFVGACGAILVVGAGIVGSLSTVVSVLVGVATAALNLIVLAWLVRSMLEAKTKGWMAVAVLKMAGLFVGVGFLLRRDVVGALPFLVGFGSLVVGIVLAQVTTSEVSENSSSSP